MTSVFEKTKKAMAYAIKNDCSTLDAWSYLYKEDIPLHDPEVNRALEVPGGRPKRMQTKEGVKKADVQDEEDAFWNRVCEKAARATRKQTDQAIDALVSRRNILIRSATQKAKSVIDVGAHVKFTGRDGVPHTRRVTSNGRTRFKIYYISGPYAGQTGDVGMSICSITS